MLPSEYGENQRKQLQPSVNRYVEQEDTKEIIDIKALQFEISQIVERQSALRNSLESIIKELEEGQNA